MLVEGKVVKVIGNNTVDINKYPMPYDVSSLNIKEAVNLSVLKEILDNFSDEEAVINEIKIEWMNLFLSTLLKMTL